MEARPQVGIENVRTVPDPNGNAVDLEVTLAAAPTADLDGTLRAAARSVTGDEIHVADLVEHPVSITAADGSVADQTTVEFTYERGSDALT